jgi:hypothetical protein
MTPREERALEIFHAAQMLLSRPPTGKRVGPRMVDEVTRGTIRIMLYHFVEPGHLGPDDLPHGLDIWAEPRRKVFSFRFDEKAFRIVAFKRGEWEEEIIAAAPEV